MSRYKKYLFAFVLVCLVQVAHAQNVTSIRGQIITFSNNQYVGLAYARVDLLYFDGRFPPGQQWRILASVTTDAYGFYFFANVPIGNYTIGINQAKSYNISVYYIDRRYYQYQQLPQFTFP